MTEETTPISNSKREIPVIEDDAFSYEGYQIVRGEFFAHTYEPSFTFNANKVSVNTACIKKLPDTDSTADKLPDILREGHLAYGLESTLPL